MIVYIVDIDGEYLWVGPDDDHVGILYAFDIHQVDGHERRVDPVAHEYIVPYLAGDLAQLRKVCLGGLQVHLYAAALIVYLRAGHGVGI